jgi:metal-responsive CopG/Arc/MetJ family transcriptional regulator
MSEMIRTHVLLPKDLLDDIDCVAGRRGRSRFIAKATHEYLKRLRRVVAAEAVAGSLAKNHIPEWDTPESAAEWVRALRREWDARFERVADEQ